MPARPQQDRQIPLWVKVIYTSLVWVPVPFYIDEYGLTNFLWFSNIALLLTAPTLWFESRWLASMLAVSVSLLEIGWILDFIVGLVIGQSPTGLTSYMFHPDIPLYLRLLSLYHIPLPFLLLWIVWRLGYEPRAWIAQSAFAWAVLITTYLVTDPHDSINWVFGPGEPQQWMHPLAWLAIVLAGFPLLVYLPTHLVLRWFYRKLYERSQTQHRPASA